MDGQITLCPKKGGSPDCKDSGLLGLRLGTRMRNSWLLRTHFLNTECSAKSRITQQSSQSGVPGPTRARRAFCLLGPIEVGRRHLRDAYFTVAASSNRFAATSFLQMPFPSEITPAPPRAPSLSSSERLRVPSALSRGWGSKSLSAIPPG